MNNNGIYFYRIIETWLYIWFEFGYEQFVLFLPDRFWTSHDVFFRKDDKLIKINQLL